MLFSSAFGIVSLLALLFSGAIAQNEPDRGFPNFDGSDHNEVFLDYGQSGISLLYQIGPVFDDNVSTFRTDATGGELPNVREISNRAFGRIQNSDGSYNLGSTKVLSQDQSILVAYWGQFIDHDLSLTPEDEEDTINVPLPMDEFWLQSDLEIPDSEVQSGTGEGTLNTAEFPNVLTAWFDASMVYGSDDTTADDLQDLPYLLVGASFDSDGGPLLPANLSDIEDKGGDEVDVDNGRELVEEERLFAAGDPRVNENPVLTALHTLFMREHNRYVDVLIERGVTGEERLFQLARLWVMALIQSITYNSWLPEITGLEEPLPAYSGYDNTINPGINAEFSTTAFRFGHTLLAGFIPFLDSDFNFNSILLRDSYFFPDTVNEFGITDMLRGCAHSLGEEYDDLFVDDIRNHLNGFSSGSLGSDLITRNILRGRIHGLEDYNSIRVAYGLAPKTSFQDITGETVYSATLSDLYNGELGDVDSFVGCMSEPPLNENAVVSECVAEIILEQFRRIRDGDFYWYENTDNGIWTTEEIETITNIDLGDVIRWNTAVADNFPSSVFIRAELNITEVEFIDCDEETNTTDSAGSTLEFPLSYFF